MAFKGDDSTFSLAATVTLALAVAAMVFVKEPLKSSRPSGNGADLNGATSELKARARLWEDPFAVVQRDLEARKERGLVLTGEGQVSLSGVGPAPARSLAGEVTVTSRVAKTESDGLGILQKRIRDVARQGDQLTALLVMTGGGSSVEDGESRIRDRYAVGAALEVGCFAPDKTQSLAYFTWEFPADVAQPGVTTPVATPYEWYSRSRIAACRAFDEKAGEEKARHVLVLWMAAEESEQTILGRIDALLFKLPQSNVTAKIVGPRNSSEFQRMLKEIQDRSQTEKAGADKKKALFSWHKGNGNIALYSPWTTAMPGLLSYGLKRGNQKDGVECRSYATCKDVFPQLLSDAHLDLRYSIDSDEVLFESLFEELNRRQVTVGEDPIALIGEWDSFYARALPLTFSAAACRYITDATVKKVHPPSDVLMNKLRGKCATTEEGVDQFKRGSISPLTLHVRQYSYLSGLDGEASDDQPGKPKPKGDDKEKDKGEGGKAKLRDIGSYERPEGPSQLDYVRRLVARIKAEDQDKNADQQGKKVKAIGILGRDAYDALLILQAVREQFPTALFFATDLDARYFHEDEQKWARNLIVVSHFGLQLGPSIQQAIPPFRNSLQTSTFFAILRAIDHVGYRPQQGSGQNAPPTGYVLNGGNGERMEYSTTIRPRLFEIGRHGAVDLSVDRPDNGLKSVHQGRSDVQAKDGTVRLPERLGPLWIVFVVLCFLTVWSHRVLWNWLTARDERDRNARAFKGLLRPAWVLLPVLGALLLWCKILHFNYVEDEPFSWFDGVSIWPTELLRLFAALLCLFFLIKACADLANNTADLTTRYFPRDDLSGMTKRGLRNGFDGFWRNLDWMFHGAKQDRPAAAVELWTQYCQAHTLPQRAARIALWFLIYLVIIFPVWRFMNDGEPRLFVPCRGEFSCGADTVVTSMSVFLLIILNLAVLDAVLLCTRWILEMPATTGLSAMGQIRLIVERTRIVNRRILYPFLALFLLIAARSHYFDNWDFPPVLILVLTVNSLVALASACMLYLAAVGARRRVLAPIQHDLDRALTQQEHAEPPLAMGPSSDSLRQIISEIDAVQQGAFVPFYQQPVVQATLVAALAFLQYWYLGQ